MRKVLFRPITAAEVAQIRDNIRESGDEDKFEIDTIEHDVMYAVVISDELAGVINYRGMPEDRSNEIALYIRPEYRKKWAQPDFWRNLFAKGFAELNCDTLRVTTSVPAVGKIVAKLGFIPFAITEQGVHFIASKHTIRPPYRKYLNG